MFPSANIPLAGYLILGITTCLGFAQCDIVSFIYCCLLKNVPEFQAHNWQSPSYISRRDFIILSANAP